MSLVNILCAGPESSETNPLAAMICFCRELANCDRINNRSGRGQIDFLRFQRTRVMMNAEEKRNGTASAGNVFAGCRGLESSSRSSLSSSSYGRYVAHSNIFRRSCRCRARRYWFSTNSIFYRFMSTAIVKSLFIGISNGAVLSRIVLERQPDHVDSLYITAGQCRGFGVITSAVPRYASLHSSLVSAGIVHFFIEE